MIRKDGLNLKLWVWVLLTMIVTLTIVPDQIVHAATITVTNGNDSGAGSLRQAITDAVTNDVVRVDSSVTTINLNTTIEKNAITFSIDLNGATINGKSGVRIFKFNSGGGVITLSNGTLTNATNVTGNGGAIHIAGGGKLVNLTITGNSSAGNGGGIYIETNNQVEIDSQTFINNNTAVSGGGIYVSSGARLHFRNSSITNNTATNRGGGVHTEGTINFVNSTISTNTATNGGGSIYQASTATVVASFVTFANNNATGATSNGIWNDGGTTILRNSILDDNGDSNCTGTIADDNGNIDSGSTCGFTGTNSLNNNANLGLQALQSGVHPILNTSSAFNSVAVCSISLSSTDIFNIYGSGATLTRDQRNVFRPQGAACDAGAFERGADNLTPGVNVQLTGSNIISEVGPTSITYRVLLTSRPTGLVVIDITNNAQTTVQPIRLEFNEVNWATAQTVTITAVDDGTIELDPHFASVVNTINTTDTLDTNYDAIDPNDITVAIIDNDAPGSVTVSSASTNEGDSGSTTNLQFTFTLDIAAAASVVITYQTQDGFATSGVDYTQTLGTITFAAGETTKTVVVPIIGDDGGENDETFTLQITSASNARRGNPSFGVGTILNDDEYSITLTATILTTEVDLVDDEYRALITASGGTPAYVFQIISGDFPFGEDNFAFDTATGAITGVPTKAYDFTFEVLVVDSVGDIGIEEFNLVINEDGTSSISKTDSDSGTTTSETATATPIPTLSPDEIEATRTANVRANVGKPRVMIDDRFDISGLSIRTGPMIGATIKRIARPGVEYNAIGKHQIAGSSCIWYLIEYPSRLPNAGESSEDVPTANGWLNGCYVILSGYVPDIQNLGNPFDSVNTSNTGITGKSALKNNLYRYATPYSALIDTFDEGETFQILSRTKVDQREITYWILVRMDRSGSVGWTRWTPYVDIFGDITQVPTY